MADIFGSYTMEVEYLLTWYPMQPNVRISEPRITGGTLVHKNTDFVANNKKVRRVDAFTTSQEEANLIKVVGFISVGVLSPDGVFQVELEVQNGGVLRRKSFIMPSNTRVPFLINVHAPGGDDSISRGTGVALQGVITTGHRFGLSDVLTDFVPRLFRP
jgi:hypothetical protein